MLDLHRYISYLSASYVPVYCSHPLNIDPLSLSLYLSRKASEFSIHSIPARVCTTSNRGPDTRASPSNEKLSSIDKRAHPGEGSHVFTSNVRCGDEKSEMRLQRFNGRFDGPFSRTMETNSQTPFTEPQSCIDPSPIKRDSQNASVPLDCACANLASKSSRAGGSYDQRNRVPRSRTSPASFHYHGR